jgi:hypothetical protein
MLQLNKSQAVNTIAIYPNELPNSGSDIYLDFTQSYSNTVTGSFIATVISDPQNTPYVIATFSGSVLPSASGQYNFDVFEAIPTIEYIWNTANINWDDADSTWNAIPFKGELLSQERAIISGSDVVPITEYVSPNENARYTVYLG